MKTFPILFTPKVFLKKEQPSLTYLDWRNEIVVPDSRTPKEELYDRHGPDQIYFLNNIINSDRGMNRQCEVSVVKLSPPTAKQIWRNGQHEDVTVVGFEAVYNHLFKFIDGTPEHPTPAILPKACIHFMREFSDTMEAQAFYCSTIFPNLINNYKFLIEKGIFRNNKSFPDARIPDERHQ